MAQSSFHLNPVIQIAIARNQACILRKCKLPTSPKIINPSLIHLSISFNLSRYPKSFIYAALSQKMNLLRHNQSDQHSFQLANFMHKAHDRSSQLVSTIFVSNVTLLFVAESPLSLSSRNVFKPLRTRATTSRSFIEQLPKGYQLSMDVSCETPRSNVSIGVSVIYRGPRVIDSGAQSRSSESF